MKGMTIVYEVGGGLYVNITTRGPDHSTFCSRPVGDGASGSYSLWLAREPTVEETVDAIFARGVSRYAELVFCGFGEPLVRLPDVTEVIRRVKARAPQLRVRINTNGLADLIWSRPTAADLVGLADAVSISLNAPDAAGYQKLCRSDFGARAYDAVLAYARDCVRLLPQVTLTVLDILPPEQIAACRAVAAAVGAPLRVRTFA